jgi:hypothetical protein
VPPIGKNDKPLQTAGLFVAVLSHLPYSSLLVRFSKTYSPGEHGNELRVHGEKTGTTQTLSGTSAAPLTSPITGTALTTPATALTTPAAVATSAASSATTAFRAWTRFIDNNRSTFDFLAVKPFYRRLAVSFRRHFHKAEAFRLSAVFVFNNGGGVNRSEFFESLPQLFFSDVIRQIPHVNLHSLLLSS